jgi:hypothetical protein
MYLHLYISESLGPLRASKRVPLLAKVVLSLRLPMHPFFGRLFVNFVLCLICFIAYSSQIFIIWPWYGNVISVELVTLLLPFKSVFLQNPSGQIRSLNLWLKYFCGITTLELLSVCIHRSRTGAKWMGTFCRPLMFSN